MQPFRFRLPFFSSDAPSRLTSGSAAAPSPPKRPPFRPAGIAQPHKAATPPPPRDAAAPPDTQSKATSPARSKSAQTGAAAAASVPPSVSRSAAASAHQTRQTKQPKSPSKKPESAKMEEPKEAVEEKLSEESPQKNEIKGEKVKAAEDGIVKINAVEEKSSVLAPEAEAERVNAEEAEEQRKKEVEKLPAQETKKVHHQDGEDQMHGRIVRPLTAALESVRGARELLQRKMLSGQQNKERTSEIRGSSGDGDIKKMTTSANHPKIRSVMIDSHENPGEANGESSSANRRIKEDINNVVSKLTSGRSNTSNGEKPVSVVTLAGENKGATMQITSEKDEKDNKVHIHRGYRSNPDESPYTTATDGEARSFKRKTQKEEPPVKAYINSNTQSINNSIVFDGSVNEHDPGVHMAFSIEEAKKESSKPENMEARKSETTVTPAENVRYEPTVRRRCLRGLFAESSESETENTQKPRRHGCRFSCKGKDKDIGIF